MPPFDICDLTPLFITIHAQIRRFYPVLGRALFGGEFNRMTKAIDASVKNANSLRKRAMKVTAAAKSEKREREAETDEDAAGDMHGGKDGGGDEGALAASPLRSVRIQKQKCSLSGAAGPAPKRQRDECTKCAALTVQLQKVRSELELAREAAHAALAKSKAPKRSPGAMRS